jgi:hypothetical protein
MTRGTEPRNVVDITGIDPIVRAARSQLIEEAIAGLEGLPVHTLSLGGALVPATDVLDRSAVLRVLRGLQESR